MRFNAAESAVYMHVYPAYRGNSGFFHLFAEGGEWVLLKSCYDDFVRIIKAGSFTEGQLLEISRQLLRIESTVTTSGSACHPFASEGELYEMKLLYDAGELCLIDMLPQKAHTADLDIKIPRPLTAGEYAEAHNSLQNEQTLYSRGLLHSVLPETLSYTMASLIKRFPDLLSAFFLMFDAKVGSPAAKVISGRAYVNISALLGGFKETRSDIKTFTKQYMPWQKIFDKEKNKAGQFITLRITDEDTESFISQISTGISNAGPYSFFDPDYFTPAASMSMGAIMLLFMFQELWLLFARLTGLSPEKALEYIYCTREESFFAKGASLRLPDYFDPALENKEITIKGGAQVLPLESVPTKFFHRKKSLAVLKRLHFLLAQRDRLLNIAGEYHLKNREILIGHGDFIAGKKSFSISDEVFNFDLEDIRKLVNGSYYANLNPMREYRTNFAARLKAQHMPYELYEADIPLAGLISEDQLHRMLERKEHSCECLNPANTKGRVNDPSSGIICARSFPLTRLAELENPRALITDTAPAFSYAREYCVMHQIPLYYGLRHSGTLLNGKEVELSGNKITIS